MTDLAKISQVGKSAGTLVLSVSTFSSVRSGARTARIAERSLLLGIRPVLFPSRPGDPEEMVGFGDGHRSRIGGGVVAIDHVDEAFYFALSLRNVGPGLAVLHAWHLRPGRMVAGAPHADPSDFRRLVRDLYVPAGDVGFWQGAIRQADDPFAAGLAEAIDERRRLTLDLLYGDHEGGQRTITRFGIIPDEEAGGWLAAVGRHWNLDGPDSR